MHAVRHSVAILFALAAAFPGVCRPDGTLLKAMPKDGEIPYGKIVYVDDGKCAKGEVKQVVGGSREKSIPRSVRCVKRPVESTPK